MGEYSDDLRAAGIDTPDRLWDLGKQAMEEHHLSYEQKEVWTVEDEAAAKLELADAVLSTTFRSLCDQMKLSVPKRQKLRRGTYNLGCGPCDDWFEHKWAFERSQKFWSGPGPDVVTRGPLWRGPEPDV